MFVLTILVKIKETILTFCQRSVTVLKMLANYEEARVKLTNTQINKLEPAKELNTGTKLRWTRKTFDMKNCFMNVSNNKR